MSDEYHRWIKTSQPTSNIFCVIIRNMWFCIIMMQDYAFSVDWFQMLFIECCFQLVEFGALLVGIHHLVFQKELMIEDSLPNPLYTQHHLFGWRLVCCGWWSGSFAGPTGSSIPPYCTVSTVLPVTICFKTGTFSLYLSEEWHVEIWSSKCLFFFFFLLNLYGTQTSNHLT